LLAHVRRHLTQVNAVVRVPNVYAFADAASSSIPAKDAASSQTKTGWHFPVSMPPNAWRLRQPMN
jgi:hypothetical protein